MLTCHDTSEKRRADPPPGQIRFRDISMTMWWNRMPECARGVVWLGSGMHPMMGVLAISAVSDACRDSRADR
jgi:hypothetical protein